MYRPFERASDYIDFLVMVKLSAPNDFDNSHLSERSSWLDLERAFTILNDRIPFLESKIKDSGKIPLYKRLLDTAYEAFNAGEDKRGRAILDEAVTLLKSKPRKPA